MGRSAGPPELEQPDRQGEDRRLPLRARREHRRHEHAERARLYRRGGQPPRPHPAAAEHMDAPCDGLRRHRAEPLRERRPRELHPGERRDAELDGTAADRRELDPRRLLPGQDRRRPRLRAGADAGRDPDGPGDAGRVDRGASASAAASSGRHAAAVDADGPDDDGRYADLDLRRVECLDGQRRCRRLRALQQRRRSRKHRDDELHLLGRSLRVELHAGSRCLRRSREPLRAGVAQRSDEHVFGSAYALLGYGKPVGRSERGQLLPSGDCGCLRRRAGMLESERGVRGGQRG